MCMCDLSIQLIQTQPPSHVYFVQLTVHIGVIFKLF